MLVYCKTYLAEWNLDIYLQIRTYYWPNWFLYIAFTNVEATLKQCRDKVVTTFFQRCFNFGHRRCINFENPTLDFVSFSTSDQRYFNVDPTFKCWLGCKSRRHEQIFWNKPNFDKKNCLSEHLTIAMVKVC